MKAATTTETALISTLVDWLRAGDYRLIKVRPFPRGASIYAKTKSTKELEVVRLTAMGDVFTTYDCISRGASLPVHVRSINQSGWSELSDPDCFRLAQAAMAMSFKLYASYLNNLRNGYLPGHSYYGADFYDRDYLCVLLMEAKSLCARLETESIWEG